MRGHKIPEDQSSSIFASSPLFYKSLITKDHYSRSLRNLKRENGERMPQDHELKQYLQKDYAINIQDVFFKQ